MLVRVVALIWFVGAASPLLAQEAFSNGLPQKDNSTDTQTTAENAWIDLRQHPSAASRPQSAPGEGESLSAQASKPIPPGEWARIAPPCSTYWGEKQDDVDPRFGGYPATLPYAICGYTPPQLRDR